jgi:type IV pilus assembly protein PilE
MNIEVTRSRAKGFTLIELVIAILIASILAAIAIPSYSNYVRKTRRTEVRSALLDMVSLEERYFSTQNTYSANFTDLGYPTAAASVVLSSGYYSIATPSITAVAVPTATTAGSPAVVTLIGTVVAGTDQAKDTNCASFTVTSAGVQSSLNSGGTDSTSICWH